MCLITNVTKCLFVCYQGQGDSIGEEGRGEGGERKGGKMWREEGWEVGDEMIEGVEDVYRR